MDEVDVMVGLADDYLATAEEVAAAHPSRRNVAYDNARHAAELAGKALLRLKHGTHPRKHEIGGDLYQAGLVPRAVEPRTLASFLAAHTRAPYGFANEPITVGELQEALEMARELVQAARAGLGER